MRHYEAMYIVDPDTSDEDLEPIIEKYKKIVTDGGGEVGETGKWEKGRRPLAYEIAKKREGIYILMQFQSEAAVPKELDRIFRISDDVLRHLVVRQDEDEE
ncbi:MAG TPA: 30S ribosomal protein S6 [Chthonomonadaceae bacterium]|jgi:small subunit ribosomal protein S6|nr:30S ribosomal protein S6 [Chthonomonadaceae bacterium]